MELGKEDPIHCELDTKDGRACEPNAESDHHLGLYSIFALINCVPKPEVTHVFVTLRKSRT